MSRLAIILLSVTALAAAAYAATTATTSAPAPAPAAAEKPQYEKATSIENEPNLKVTTGSGGVATSSLITNAPLASDHVMGDPAAPLVLVEYASLSCPHCAHFSGAVLPELKKKYIDTGKMAYVLRQFPLNEPALKGAMLLDCVGEQSSEKYYVFAGVIFDAQSKWAFDGNYLTGLETIAQIGGLSKEQFAGCVQSTDREMKVLKAKKDATDELKIPHTPYIYIGGEVYGGERTVEAVSAFIDAKLAKIQQKN